MTGEEFALWLALADEEPFGDELVRIGQAQIRAAVANGNLKPPNGRRSFSPIDFYPVRWQAPDLGPATAREPTAEEIEKRLGG